MGKEPLIRQGWLRALVFIVAFSSVNIFLDPLLRSVMPGNNAATEGLSDGTASGINLSSYLTGRLLLSAVVSFVLVWLFRKFVDARSFVSLGLTGRNSVSHGAAGFFAAIFLLGLGTLVLSGFGLLQWLDVSFNSSSLLISSGFILVTAAAEELVFRGYLLGNLMDSVNKWMALVVSAFVFALFHRQNPGMNLVAFVNILLGGLLLGVNFIYTRNLWFGILLHFTWNFYQGPVLGYRLSGLPLESVLQQELTGSEILTGGSFGFEGSVVNSVLLLLAVPVLAWLYHRRFHGQTASIQQNSLPNPPL